jgi:Na+/proline symporter
MTMALNHWDWIVIGFYFVFIIGIGYLFKHVSKNSSDYFRGGGNMLWWMAGMSAVMAGLSTWSFTGAAAKVYETGFLLPLTWIVGTPIDHAKEDVRDQDAMQYRLVSIMCLVFGGFALFGILIPNPLNGRLAFLFVGGVIFALGVWLYAVSVKKFKEHPDAEI